MDYHDVKDFFIWLVLIICILYGFGDRKEGELFNWGSFITAFIIGALVWSFVFSK